MGVQQHPLAAAATLRNHGLAETFLAITTKEDGLGAAASVESPVPHTMTDESRATVVDALPAELATEDNTLVHILGMPHHPVVGTGKPKTCKCGRCRPVKNSKARNCCRDTPGRCVLLWDHELRGIVLGSRAVRAALNQARCLRHQDSWDHENANLRFQAYQQYIYATIGTTGSGNRVPIPACVCWAIRDRWPGVSYVGFKEAPVNGMHACMQQVTNVNDSPEQPDSPFSEED